MPAVRAQLPVVGEPEPGVERRPGTVELTLRRPPAAAGAGAVAVVRTINSTCAAPKAVWEGRMASVAWPSAAQLEALRAASRVCEERVELQWSAAGAATVEVVLEAYAAVQVAVQL